MLWQMLRVRDGNRHARESHELWFGYGSGRARVVRLQFREVRLADPSLARDDRVTPRPWEACELAVHRRVVADARPFAIRDRTMPSSLRRCHRCTQHSPFRRALSAWLHREGPNQDGRARVVKVAL